MNTAALFPGQGSQSVGMGRELAAQFAVARRVYEEADAAVGFSLSELCFRGPEEKLRQTEFGQPAILATSVAALRVAQSELGLTFDVAAGHSLGEWTALVATGALSLRDAVTLVHARGRAMQTAVPAGRGTMAAIIGLDLDTIASICAESAQAEVCSPANLNGGGQVVVSGHTAAVERAIALATKQGARKAVVLQVSAPFHCALMEPAAVFMSDALARIEIGEFAMPVIANVDAAPNSDPTRVKPLLIEQITAPVKWEASMSRLAELGVTAAYELGPGSVLRGLMRRITRQVKVTGIGAPADINTLQAASAQA